MTEPLDPKALHQEIIASNEAFRTRAKGLIGRRIRVTAFYNGQPCGTSKKNLEGTELEIRGVSVSDYGLSILPVGHLVWMHIDQWELLP
jgi:hypothetical protein